MLTIYRHILTWTAAALALTASADLLDEGRTAFEQYDFERASDLYGQFAQSMRKKPNPEREALLEAYERQLETAENFLDNVQKIEIIDRIDVPSDGFFESIMLPYSGGRIISSSNAPFKESRGADFIFSDESGDFIMWTQTDTDGRLRIAESTKLTDGSWEDPIVESEILNDGGNAKNPFMLTDGSTLYFAGDGEGSMGGFDIFIATKDPSTGEYRQPLNVGFPFNSPANEYLLAIDEENGVGWWVTDRNALDGKVSIYVYLTSDTRKNYNADEEDDIISLASASDIKITQNPETDYTNVKHRIAVASKPTPSKEKADFRFVMPGGRIYTKLAEFSSASARRLMQQYVAAEKEHVDDLESLAGLRKKYHDFGRANGSSGGIAAKIIDLEKKTQIQREKLQSMRNSIITAETKRQ